MIHKILDFKQSLITGGYFMFTFSNVDYAMKIIAFIIATGIYAYNGSVAFGQASSGFGSGGILFTQ